MARITEIPVGEIKGWTSEYNNISVRAIVKAPIIPPWVGIPIFIRVPGWITKPIGVRIYSSIICLG